MKVAVPQRATKNAETLRSLCDFTMNGLSRSRPKAAQGELKRIVETFFDGSVEQAVAGLLQSADVELNEDELDRLGQMIGKARKEGR